MCAPFCSSCSGSQAYQGLQNTDGCQGVFMEPILSAIECIKCVWRFPEVQLVKKLDSLLICRCPRWLSSICRCFAAFCEGRNRARECRWLMLLQELKAKCGPVVLGMACSSLLKENRRYLCENCLRRALDRECLRAQEKLVGIFCYMRALAIEARALTHPQCSPTQQFAYAICLGSGSCSVRDCEQKRHLLRCIQSSCPTLYLDHSSRTPCSNSHLFDPDEELCHRLLFLVLCAIKNEAYFS